MSSTNTRDADAKIDALIAAGAELRMGALEERCEAIARALKRLRDPADALGQEARTSLPKSTGLSPAMVDWALEQSLRDIDANALNTLAERRASSPEEVQALAPRWVLLILAGNLFTACLRSVLPALVYGAPLWIKVSSKGDGFPALLQRALCAEDPRLAAALHLDEGKGEAMPESCFARAEVAIAYGSDATCRAIRERLPIHSNFIAHGHGLGLSYVARATLEDAELRAQALQGIALDLAAYDQRGCLSPHALYLESDDAEEGRSFAESLAHQAMKAMAERLPRGPLPYALGGAQLQWRSLAAYRGQLFEGEGFALSYEHAGSFRLSPGWRNLQILPCRDLEDFCARTAPLAHHLKCIGVAGPTALRRRLTEALPLHAAPRICAAGEMQRPPFLGLSDGDALERGLRRWREWS